MIEWTQQERQFARHNGDGEITKVIDGFNRCVSSEQMLHYMLEMPPEGWACERWRAIPISKFGDVLHTILSAENNEVCKLRALVKELEDALTTYMCDELNGCATRSEREEVNNYQKKYRALVARAKEVAK